MTSKYDSTGAMAAAWFGTTGADKAIDAIFPGKPEPDKPTLAECMSAVTYACCAAKVYGRDSTLDSLQEALLQRKSMHDLFIKL